MPRVGHVPIGHQMYKLATGKYDIKGKVSTASRQASNLVQDFNSFCSDKCEAFTTKMAASFATMGEVKMPQVFSSMLNSLNESISNMEKSMQPSQTTETNSSAVEQKPDISVSTSEETKETKETSKNRSAQFRNKLVSIAKKMQKMTVSSKTGPVVKYSSFDKQNAAKTQSRDKVDVGEKYSVKDQFGEIQTYTKSDNLNNDQRV